MANPNCPSCGRTAPHYTIGVGAFQCKRCAHAWPRDGFQDEDPKRFDLEFRSGGLHVDLWYPGPGSPALLSVGLMHVRAAQDITIEYDLTRDGYVIRMDKTRDFPGGGGCEVIDPAVEVAFVPAWNEDDDG